MWRAIRKVEAQTGASARTFHPEPHLQFPTRQAQYLRARAKITYHFGIPASGYLWPILIRKTIEIACYSCGFAQSDRPNLTQI